jgi:hypothetical protein
MTTSGLINLKHRTLRELGFTHVRGLWRNIPGKTSSRSTHARKISISIPLVFKVALPIGAVRLKYVLRPSRIPEAERSQRK